VGISAMGTGGQDGSANQKDLVRGTKKPHAKTGKKPRKTEGKKEGTEKGCKKKDARVTKKKKGKGINSGRALCLRVGANRKEKGRDTTLINSRGREKGQKTLKDQSFYRKNTAWDKRQKKKKKKRKEEAEGRWTSTKVDHQTTEEKRRERVVKT